MTGSVPVNQGYRGGASTFRRATSLLERRQVEASRFAGLRSVTFALDAVRALEERRTGLLIGARRSMPGRCLRAFPSG
jgi:hypothetical protein